MALLQMVETRKVERSRGKKLQFIDQGLSILGKVRYSRGKELHGVRIGYDNWVGLCQAVKIAIL